MMHGRKYLFSSIAALCAFASSASAQDVPCDANGSNTLVMAACAGAAYKEADEVMNAIYAELLKQAQALDQAATIQSTDKAADRLRKAQRAWLVWRDAECPLRSMRNLGGTIERIAIPNCLAALTSQRSEQLAELVKASAVQAK